MRAIHWIRSRQESEELSYWLSFVSYNPKDRSLNNRIYLVYLLVFFSFWWFMVLVWFANTGASLLSLIFPASPLGGAIGLELIVLLLWFLTVLFLALRRSPVAFSEEDAYLVCQMPFRPRSLVFRWSLMPWVKSVVPFLILAMVLGFSLAEIDLVQQGISDPNIFAYIVRGVRAALALLPVQLTAFMLIWANGVWIMSRQRRFAAWIVPLVTLGLVGLLFVSGIWASFGAALPAWMLPFSQVLPGLLGAGFGEGLLGIALRIGGLSALVSILVLVLSAGRFSPSQAAQETQTQVTNRNLRRYGFSDRVQDRKTQKRLGVRKRAAWLPDWQGPVALTWKDMLQTWRSIRISYAYQLLTFFGAGLGLVFIPSLGGRILLILTWSMQATKFLTDRLREDLSHWVLLRQLPQKSRDWILADLAFPAGLLLLVSLLGMLVGAALGDQSPWNAILSMPGMIASAAGVSEFMIFRHAKVDLLMSGQAPGVNEFGIFLAALCAAIPVTVYSLAPNFMGAALGLGASLVIGGMALSSAFRAFQRIE
jgi:hypothetical protein